MYQKLSQPYVARITTDFVSYFRAPPLLERVLKGVE
jgi:hypothetical protein